jgi:hypothetical protein
MHVPIDDCDPLDFRILLLRITRRDCYVVEETKSHRTFFRRVVSRRPHGNKSILDLAAHYQINGLTWSAGRASRSIKRTHRHHRILIKISGAFTHDSFDVLVKLWRVSGLNITTRRFPRLNLAEFGPEFSI